MLQLKKSWTVAVVPKIGCDANALVQAAAVHVNKNTGYCFPGQKTLCELCPVERNGELVPMTRRRYLAALKRLKDNGVIERFQTFKKNGDFGIAIMKLTNEFIKVWVDFSGEVEMPESEQKGRTTKSGITPTENGQRDTESGNTLAESGQRHTTLRVSLTGMTERSNTSITTPSNTLTTATKKIDKKAEAVISEPYAKSPPGCAAPPQKGSEKIDVGTFEFDLEKDLAEKAGMGVRLQPAKVARVLEYFFTEVETGQANWEAIRKAVGAEAEELSQVFGICLDLAMKAHKGELHQWRQKLLPRARSFAQAALLAERAAKAKASRSKRSIKAKKEIDYSPQNKGHERAGNEQFG